MEEWRNIPSAPGYQASNLGRIRSCKKILKPLIDRKGYVQFSPGFKKPKKMVHRAVLEAFGITVPEQVNHRNGIKGDNLIENLEPCTGQENMSHAVRYGLAFKNQRNRYLSEPDIRAVRFFAVGKQEVKILAKIMDRHPDTIEDIAQRRTYKWVA